MPVVSQWPLKRCQALWRGAAFGSHLAAWVVLVRSYCTICMTRSRMARSHVVNVDSVPGLVELEEGDRVCSRRQAGSFASNLFHGLGWGGVCAPSFFGRTVEHAPTSLHGTLYTLARSSRGERGGAAARWTDRHACALVTPSL
eukprot:scaffold79619_cov54-Phaeocystis_antarctica.AAC.2